MAEVSADVAVIMGQLRDNNPLNGLLTVEPGGYAL